MKKYILLFIAFIIIFSLIECQRNTLTNAHSIENITYFKDIRTGLCFGAINSVTYGGSEVTSITCDSLKNINVQIISRN